MDSSSRSSKRGSTIIRRIGVIFRAKGTPPAIICYGSERALDEIPVSEIWAVAAEIRIHACTFPGTDEHLKAISEYYGIRRLTRPVRNRLSAILQ